MRIDKNKEFKERKSGYGGIIYLSKVRPTDLPTNKDILNPGPAKLNVELEIQLTNVESMTAVNEFVDKCCDEQGKI